LRQDGVAELLRPLEFVVQHLKHRGRCRQRFDALVPALFADFGFELGTAEPLVGGQPALGLNDFQRKGRGHQDLGDQRVGIERDRSQQRVELSSGQQLLGLIGGSGDSVRLRRRDARSAGVRLRWGDASGSNQERERDGGQDSDHRDHHNSGSADCGKQNDRSAHYSALLAINSVVVMVLFIFPSLVRRKRRFQLKIRRHRDPLPLVPRQREVLVLELVRESDMARVLETGPEVEVVDPRPVDGAHAHRTRRSIDVDLAPLKHLCALRNQVGGVGGARDQFQHRPRAIVAAEQPLRVQSA
jgi:hypothetical protein